MTVIVVVAGIALGARSGFAVGVVAAFVSNFFLGQGSWTPWQMLGWGACGVAGALAAPLLRRRVAARGVLFRPGVAFSAFMDVWTWLSFYDQHTWQTFVAVHGRGLPFDLAHGIGNVVIALVAGPGAEAAARPLQPAAAGGGDMDIAALLAAVALAVTPASFVRSHQSPDGGVAEAQGGRRLR